MASSSSESKTSSPSPSSSAPSSLREVSDKVDFSFEEDKVLKYWESINAFETSLKQSAEEGRKPYMFYDGPPFATGLPHYGHILAGTIKDTVTRYAQQTGHHVVRRFGWDCHGLPVEYEIDQKLGIKSKDDVLKMGVAAYNAECRSIVQRYAHEWEVRVKRLGRWIDFKNDYKTMNHTFMESVWWVFKQLHEKGLVYRGFKVMPYSTACNTPLSNFEANSNYKDVSDPSVVVTFPWRSDPNTAFLAWTTTPWTLPSNLGLAIRPDFLYVKVKDIKSGMHYILLKNRLTEVYPSAKKFLESLNNTPDAGKDKKEKKPAKEESKEFEIIEEMKGEKLVGIEYVPLFDYFYEREKKTAFRSVSADYVTDDSGVGIVHLAPAFGEDDYSVCLKHGIIQKGFNIVCPVDDNGRFTKEVPEFVGRHVKEADKDIIALLKKNGRLVTQGAIVHSYPFCWRSETPLIYRAVPSWFVRVEQIKEKLLSCNSETYWVPSFVKEKRFHNWLQDAKDWAISRNRFWGTPIPIWMSDDAEEMVVVGSIAELEKLTGAKNINDLHKDKIDHLTIPSSKGKGVLKRIPEVFDCWFESGSMPYAQLHYPFENKEVFENGFPADFIAEGLDQTRGWFYTLMVISTALYGKPAFKNLIVNGLVLAADGKKMSKRLKNYPDPMEVVKKYGADALRLYLINSPAVRAEPLRFQEAGVFDLIKRVFLPWFHSYRFFVENTLRFEHVFKQTFTANPSLKYSVNNVMDKWILSSLQSLIGFVHDEMKAYRLYTVVPELVVFIENLTNWYVRMNRKRLKGAKGKEDTLLALNTLFEVLITLCKIMAPFTPFLVEMMYQNLKQVLPVDQQSPSVHFLLLPIKDEKQIDPKVEMAVKRMQNVVEDGRCARDKRAIGLKQPLPRLIVCHRDINFINDLKSLSHYIAEECNVQTVEFELDVSKWAILKLEINQKNVGPRVGKKLKAIKEAAEKLSHADVEKIQQDKKWVIEGETLALEDIEIKWVFKSAESSTTEEKVEEQKEETTPKGEKGKKKEKPEKGAKGGKGGAGGAGKKENESVFQPSQEKGTALVILDTTYVLELVQQGLAREVINRIQKLRKIAELVPTDPIEIFYTVKKGSELESAIIGQSSYLSQVVSRPIFEISHLPSYAVIIAKQDSDIDGEPITITLTRPTLFFNDTALSALGFSNEFIVSIKNALLNKEWINFQSTIQKLSSPIVAFNLDGKDVAVQAGEHFYFTGAEAFKH